MDRRIKIRHISAFVEIVRQRSLKRAADQLHLTQPAISRTLAELEEIAGAQLLNRGRAGVSLTAQGEYFYSFAQKSLAALEQGFAGVDAAGGEEPTEIRVGALPSVATRLMPEVAAQITAFTPIRLTIADGSHEHLIAQLRSGLLDVVVGRLGAPESMRGVSFTQLYLEDVAVVVRPGHPIIADPDIRRIAEWLVIFPPPWTAIRPYVERLLIAEGVPKPRRRIETVSGAFGRVYARSCDAIWFISAGVVATEIAEGRLVRLPIATSGTEGPVGLMIRAGEPETPEQQAFRLAVDRALATLGDAIQGR
jgi:LysR family transcriptional regulator, pca operon transcriptional activator